MAGIEQSQANAFGCFRFMILDVSGHQHLGPLTLGFMNQKGTAAAANRNFGNPPSRVTDHLQVVNPKGRLHPASELFKAAFRRQAADTTETNIRTPVLQGKKIKGHFLVGMNLEKTVDHPAAHLCRDGDLETPFGGAFKLSRFADKRVATGVRSEGPFTGSAKGAAIIGSDAACTCFEKGLGNLVLMSLGNKDNQFQQFSLAPSQKRHRGHQAEPLRQPVIQAGTSPVKVGMSTEDCDTGADRRED